jgi:deoxyribonuclease-4
MPKIGVHAPIKGGLHNALLVARDTGCETVQLFSRNPRAWAAKPLTAPDIKTFRQTRKLTKISPVLIHCNYLVNLAAFDQFFLEKSILAFQEEVERALLLGVD